MSDQRLHIAIDVSVAEDQIRGHVCDGVCEPRQFVGWLGLIGELDGMLGSVAPGAPAPGKDQDGGKGGGGSR